jgi:two-component system nitrate/nitrite response regulator NarL
MEPSLSLVGEAADGESGLRLARATEPDLILLDLNMKGMDGIATLQRIRAAGLDARVVMLTVSDSEEDVVAALRAGADGYLLKDMEPEDILACLQRATRGRLVISERLTELLAHALREEPRPQRIEDAGLTPREEEILALIAKGWSNKLIARDLDLSVGTIKVHVKHLLKKLKLKTRVEAAVWALNSRR